MRKIFTLLFISLLSATALAQSEGARYAFVDKDGNAFMESEITCATVEDDGFSVIIPSGLYIANVSGGSNTTVTVQADIMRLDNGMVQLCFPLNCKTYSTTGEQTATDKGSIAQGERRDMQTEWLPDDYGECRVKYTVQVYESAFKQESFSIIVNYKYDDPAGMRANLSSRNAHSSARYDLSGRRATRGFTIMRMADGSVRKVISR